MRDRGNRSEAVWVVAAFSNLRTATGLGFCLQLL